MRTRGTILVVAAVVAVGAVSAAIAATVPVPNGDFENGNLQKWGTLEQGDGDWHVYTADKGPPPPRRGLPVGLQDPPQGTYAAGVTQGGPGLNILHRVLKLKPGKINKIRFLLFYRNTAPKFISPKNFDFQGKGMPRFRRGGGGTNQQLRIDIMDADAGLKSLKNEDILATLLWTKPGDPKQRAYKPLKANLTKLGIDDKRVRLRIAEVDDFGEFPVGVDKLRQKVKPN